MDKSETSLDAYFASKALLPPSDLLSITQALTSIQTHSVSKLKHPLKSRKVSLQSLNSRGFVKTQFSWQYYYYSLTNEGIEYLREFLHLPAEIVPRTFIKTAKSVGQRPARPDGPRESRPTEEYRKKETATGEFRPEFK